MQEKEIENGIALEELKRVIDDAAMLEELQAVKLRVDAAAKALRAAVVE